MIGSQNIGVAEDKAASSDAGSVASSAAATGIRVALLTGGDDKTYAVGLTMGLTELGVRLDYIGSDLVDAPELHTTPLVSFLNLRGDQSEDASSGVKVRRILLYYARLVKYTALANPRLFHILWNNKFEFVDRVLLMLYYRALGKRVVLTAHNVNAAKRDNRDSALNRWTLRMQYRLCHHVFVHTQKMKTELLTEFRVPETKATVIPFGVNSVFPMTKMTTNEAKTRLGLRSDKKAILFFGQIAPYKGLEHLVDAFIPLAQSDANYRLIIAGRPKQGHGDYWKNIEQKITSSGVGEGIIQHVKFIPESDVEMYFKAADVLVIPYVQIFQSGVPFLGFNYGLPVIATDVGSLREDIIEGKNGLLCRPRDPADLARTIRTFFEGDLYRQLESRRAEIRALAMERHSWDRVGKITRDVYDRILGGLSRNDFIEQKGTEKTESRTKRSVTV